MKNKIFLLLLIISFSAFAQVPTTLSYQGLLTDTNGNPVADASYDITFNFYTVASGGTVAFAKGPISVTTFKGLFTVILGNGQGNNNTALPYTLGSQQYYVGIKNGTQAELDPRVMLTAVPYAFKAQSVTAVDATIITTGTMPDARLSTHLQDLADGSLTGSKVGTGISASNVTTGTLPVSVIPSGSTSPVGTVIAFAGTTIPSGWLLCDGTAVSRSTYSALFAVVSATWGGGNGSSTFNLPDLQGRFLRGRDNGKGNDPDAATRTALFPGAGVATGDNVGSYQQDELKSHQHSFNMNTQAVNQSGAAAVSNANVNTGQTSFTGGSESRPKNASVNFIIKY